MAQITAIDLGTIPNDGTGDVLRFGGQIINDNFAELNVKKLEAGTFIGTATDLDGRIANIESDYATLSTAQTFTGVKTFNSLPVSSVVPTLAFQFTNKNYVDNAIANISGYEFWNLKTNGVQRTTIQDNGVLDLVEGDGIKLSYSAGGVVEIAFINDDLGFISDAPNDGNFYGRQNGAWVQAQNTIPTLQQVLDTGNTSTTNAQFLEDAKLQLTSESTFSTYNSSFENILEVKKIDGSATYVSGIVGSTKIEQLTNSTQRGIGVTGFSEISGNTDGGRGYGLYGKAKNNSNASVPNRLVGSYSEVEYEHPFGANTSVNRLTANDSYIVIHTFVTPAKVENVYGYFNEIWNRGNTNEINRIVGINTVIRTDGGTNLDVVGESITFQNNFGGKWESGAFISFEKSTLDIAYVQNQPNWYALKSQIDIQSVFSGTIQAKSFLISSDDNDPFDGGNGFYATLNSGTLTGLRNYTFQDADGTVAFLSDTLGDAPSDSNTYGRQNGAWIEILSNAQNLQQTLEEGNTSTTSAEFIDTYINLINTGQTFFNTGQLLNIKATTLSNPTLANQAMVFMDYTVNSGLTGTIYANYLNTDIETSEDNNVIYGTYNNIRDKANSTYDFLIGSWNNVEIQNNLVDSGTTKDSKFIYGTRDKIEVKNNGGNTPYSFDILASNSISLVLDDPFTTVQTAWGIGMFIDVSEGDITNVLECFNLDVDVLGNANITGDVKLLSMSLSETENGSISGDAYIIYSEDDYPSFFRGDIELGDDNGFKAVLTNSETQTADTIITLPNTTGNLALISDTLGDAPNDGLQYARQNESWTAIQVSQTVINSTDTIEVTLDNGEYELNAIGVANYSEWVQYFGTRGDGNLNVQIGDYDSFNNNTYIDIVDATGFIDLNATQGKVNLNAPLITALGNLELFFTDLQFRGSGTTTITKSSSGTNTINLPSASGTFALLSDIVAGIGEAPNDGKQYARQNESWQQVITGGGGYQFITENIDVNNDFSITIGDLNTSGIEVQNQSGFNYIQLGNFNFDTRVDISTTDVRIGDQFGLGTGTLLQMFSSSIAINVQTGLRLESGFNTQGVNLKLNAIASNNKYDCFFPQKTGNQTIAMISDLDAVGAQSKSFTITDPINEVIPLFILGDSISIKDINVSRLGSNDLIYKLGYGNTLDAIDQDIGGTETVSSNGSNVLSLFEGVPANNFVFLDIIDNGGATQFHITINYE